MSDGLTDREALIRAGVDLDTIARSIVVKRYMARIASEHADPLTGEVCATTLAEAAANAFDLYEDDNFTIAAALYDVAAEVAAAGPR